MTTLRAPRTRGRRSLVALATASATALTLFAGSPAMAVVAAPDGTVTATADAGTAGDLATAAAELL